MVDSLSKKPIELALFFTRTISLRTWDRLGILDREAALYRKLAEQGIRSHFITYGDVRDLRYADRLPGITVHCNRWCLPRRLYARWLLALHGHVLRRCHVYKSNQIDGASVALEAARRWHRPMIARCGFLWSETVECRDGFNVPEAIEARRVEREVFAGADRCVVTTPAMAARVATQVPEARGKIDVIPNYVDTRQFAPDPAKTSHRPTDVLFVGRISEEKNVDLLCRAVGPLSVTVRLVGRSSAKSPAVSLPGQARIEFVGPRPHTKLPDEFRRAKVFVLPSRYEGHPKALLEAMACECAVVGTDVPGIREVIHDGENGLLCRADVASIRAAVERLLRDEALRRRLGKNARRAVVRNCSLKAVVTKECHLIQELIHHDRMVRVA